MSSIPNSAMPHAKVHHDDDHKPKPPKPPTTCMSVMTLPASEVSLSATSSPSKGPDTVTVLFFSS